MLQKAFYWQPVLEIDNDQRIKYCSVYTQPLMWGNEYIKPCANKYVIHLVKLLQSPVFVKQFCFAVIKL